MEKIDLPTLPTGRQAGQAGEAHFVVSVKEPPIQGRANQAILKALARFLDVAPSRLRIISGYTSRQKVIEVV